MIPSLSFLKAAGTHGRIGGHMKLGPASCRFKSALTFVLLFGTTLLLTNCVGGVEGSGAKYADTGGYYTNGVYGDVGPDLYIFGDGYYGGRNFRDYSRRGFAGRGWDRGGGYRGGVGHYGGAHAGGGHIGGGGGHSGGGGGHAGGGGRH